MIGPGANWGEIMCRPDCEFGRRWPILFSHYSVSTNAGFLISDHGLPDKVVLWELATFFSQVDQAAFQGGFALRLKLGDFLPTTTAEVDDMEWLVPAAEFPLVGSGAFACGVALRGLKIPIDAQGRRVVLEYTALHNSSTVFSVGLVFSGVPGLG